MFPNPCHMGWRAGCLVPWPLARVKVSCFAQAERLVQGSPGRCARRLPILVFGVVFVSDPGGWSTDKRLPIMAKTNNVSACLFVCAPCASILDSTFNIDTAYLTHALPGDVLAISFSFASCRMFPM
jgi:hypothetical protein